MVRYLMLERGIKGVRLKWGEVKMEYVYDGKKSGEVN